MNRGTGALWEGFLVAWQAIRGNKIRSLLTVLGVSVSVSVVVTIAALISGLRTEVMSGFESAGPNNFVLTRIDFSGVTLSFSGPPEWLSRPEITPEYADRIGELPAIEQALFNVSFATTITFEGQSLGGIQSQGYSAGWPAYQPGDFVAGRDFTPTEVQQGRQLVVISAGLAEDLFGGRDPIGRRVGVETPFRSAREEFSVVGVYDPGENIFSDAISQWAIFPYSAAQRRLNAPDFQAQVMIVPADSVNIREAQDQVIGLMRGLRGLGPRDENDFSLLESAQLIELFDQLTGVFFLVMLGLSSSGLLVGGIGVVGIMLISVTERTREIGIRKSVGATRRDILWQFLVEASLLTMLGGAVGMAVGGGASELIEAYTPIPASIPLWAIITALAMAAVTGMLFGLLPAYRAARLEPVEALRFE